MWCDFLFSFGPCSGKQCMEYEVTVTFWGLTLNKSLYLCFNFYICKLVVVILAYFSHSVMKNKKYVLLSFPSYNLTNWNTTHRTVSFDLRSFWPCQRLFWGRFVSFQVIWSNCLNWQLDIYATQGLFFWLLNECLEFKCLSLTVKKICWLLVKLKGWSKLKVLNSWVCCFQNDSTLKQAWDLRGTWNSSS